MELAIKLVKHIYPPLIFSFILCFNKSYTFHLCYKYMMINRYFFLFASRTVMFILQNLWNVNLIHAFLTLLSFGYFKIFVGIVCASLATDLKYQKMTPSILKRCKHKNYCQSRYFIDRILTKIWFHTYSPFYWYQTTNYKQTLHTLQRSCKKRLQIIPNYGHLTVSWFYKEPSIHEAPMSHFVYDTRSKSESISLMSYLSDF